MSKIHYKRGSTDVTTTTVNNNNNNNNNDNNTNNNSNHNSSSEHHDTDNSGRGSSCLSPATRIRLAADMHRLSNSDDDSGCALEEYAWVPNGLKPDQVHQYFSSVPEEKVPYLNSTGEKWRIRQLMMQLPPQDSDVRYCRYLSESEEKELKLFANQRKKEALGRGIVKQAPYKGEQITTKCKQCTEVISAGELVVCATKAGDRAVYHVACFCCNTCDELLVDLIYFHRDSQIYCGRHHAELIKPRCGGCDEIIFSEECTEAEGRSWHMTHFACMACGAQLGGQRYVMQKQSPYCVECFQELVSLTCCGCSQPITFDQKHVTHGDGQWHADPKCLKCANCSISLLGEPILPRRGKIYCSVDCAVPETGGKDRVRFEVDKKSIVPCRRSAQSSSENIYETVLPPNHSVFASNDRMINSVIAESGQLKKQRSTRARRRRHRSLTDDEKSRRRPRPVPCPVRQHREELRARKSEKKGKSDNCCDRLSSSRDHCCGESSSNFESGGGASTDYRNPTTDYRNPPTDYRNPSTDYRNPATDHRNPATDYRNPSADYCNPSAHYRNPGNDKRRLSTRDQVRLMMRKYHERSCSTCSSSSSESSDDEDDDYSFFNPTNNYLMTSSLPRIDVQSAYDNRNKSKPSKLNLLNLPGSPIKYGKKVKNQGNGNSSAGRFLLNSAKKPHNGSNCIVS